MADIATLISFTAGTTAVAADVNANFTEIRNKVNADFLQNNKTGQTVTVAITWSAAQTFQAVVTVTSGGITVTGNSTITGTLGGITGLTVVSGGVTVTAGNVLVTAGNVTVTAGNLTLTAGHFVMSAGQANLTRVDGGDTGTAKTLDFNLGNIHKVRLTGNCTFTFSNPVTGATYFIELLQDATGSRTVTWPATVKWGGGGTAPTLTTTASRKDCFCFFWNGVAYLGSVFDTNYVETT